MSRFLTFALTALGASAALAAPVKYTIDPDHTFPSFTADHMGGLSTWRGKFNKTTGTIVLDREAQTGSVDVTIDAASLDFGHDKLNAHAKSPDMFDVAKYPTATYTGKLTKFVNGAPTAVEGSLTLHGVTKPVTLKLDSFLCKPHPLTKKEVCGANASGTINRKDFGVSYGEQLGFDMNTGITIQVEALKAEQST
jgi:polyisoprenoid-binding protein YceI